MLSVLALLIVSQPIVDHSFVQGELVVEELAPEVSAFGHVWPEESQYESLLALILLRKPFRVAEMITEPLHGGESSVVIDKWVPGGSCNVVATKVVQRVRSRTVALTNEHKAWPMAREEYPVTTASVPLGAEDCASLVELWVAALNAVRPLKDLYGKYTFVDPGIGDKIHFGSYQGSVGYMTGRAFMPAMSPKLRALRAVGDGLEAYVTSSDAMEVRLLRLRVQIRSARTLFGITVHNPKQPPRQQD